MKTVLIINQKGGVGKSLIADELAFSLERSDIPYSFYDLDGQGGTIHKTNKNPKAKVRVVDTAAGIIKETNDFIKGADLIVIPTRPTAREIVSLYRMHNLVKKNSKCPVIFVINSFNRYTVCSEFVKHFDENFGEQIVYKLPHSEVFVRANLSKISAVELNKRSKAALSIKELCNGIRKELGLDQEI